MTTRVHIPETIEEAQATLGSLGKLLTAKGWERAAIVYAFTRDGGQGEYQRAQKEKIFSLTVPEFADLGINGLSSAPAVRAHRNNWRYAIEQEWAQPVAPGDDVTLPAEDYPPTGNGHGLADDLRQSESPEVKAAAIRQIMAADPDVERAVERDFVQKAAKDPALAYRVRLAAEEQQPVPMVREVARPWSGMAVGALVYEAVKRQSEQVAKLAADLRGRRNIDAQTMREVQDELESLGQARALIGEYEDTLRGAIGIDYDATFTRLVNGSAS